MTIVPQNETIYRLREIKQPKDWSGLNVHFLGFDSLSHMAFIRNLPKTVEYLENVMGSVILNGKSLKWKFFKVQNWNRAILWDEVVNSVSASV